MTKVHPFGQPNKAKNADDQDTPQQDKFEKATGKDSDTATGDVDKKKDTVATDPSASGVSAPSGADKDLWAEAEKAVVNMSGGFAGVGPEGRKQQIQKQYDQMIANDKQTKEWAAGSGILGDVGEKEEKGEKK